MNTVEKKIAVTGGSGYVGSRVVRELAELGYAVVAVDVTSPIERGIIFPEQVEFRKHDLRIPDEAKKAMQGIDVVLHLAADIGSLNYMHEHQADIITTNALIDSALYPALVANGVRHIVYSSSSGVYQHAPRYPYKETDITEIHPPTNPYFFSKLAGEYFCKSYAEQYGIQYTIIRFHNIYGAGEDSKGSTPGDIHVIPALLEKVIMGQYPLEFLGDPNATRPFVYVDDAVRATVLVTEKAVMNDSLVLNTDFNIGNSEHYSILDLGKIIWEMYGDERVFTYTVIDTVANTALRREVDISKIKDTLGWEPKVTLREGLANTAVWIIDRKKSRGE